MQLRRTANAGILLSLDGVRILMDGVCREVKPYPATPPEIKAELMGNFPDAVAFTHGHKDHYDPGFAAAFRQTNGVILGAADCHSSMEPMQVGGVRITPVPSRHIGIAGKTTPHASFIVEGSRCLWFLGDAAPTQWRGREDLPKPDVLLVPYAYATTPSAWELTQSLGAKKVVMLHLPERKDDEIGLWAAIEATVGQGSNIIFPEINETVIL